MDIDKFSFNYWKKHEYPKLLRQCILRIIAAEIPIAIMAILMHYDAIDLSDTVSKVLWLIGFVLFSLVCLTGIICIVLSFLHLIIGNIKYSHYK